MSEHSHVVQEKPEWGDGPWQHEPDRVGWVDEDTGLHCVIVRQPSSGHLCGYVAVPPEHPWHGVDYNDPLPDSRGYLRRVWDALRGHKCEQLEDWEAPRPASEVSVHGGMTYSGPAEGRWWFGFDCAHAGDLCPGHGARDIWPLTGELYRDLPYVRGEVQSLARQLKAVSQ